MNRFAERSRCRRRRTSKPSRPTGCGHTEHSARIAATDSRSKQPLHKRARSPLSVFLTAGASLLRTAGRRIAKQLLDDDGSPIFYTEETYEHPNGNDLVVFQDHWFGHRKPGEDGYQPPHVRPFGDTRNGQLPGCEEHYYYDR